MTAVPATSPVRGAVITALASVLAVGSLAACTGERPELSDDTTSSTTTSTTEASTTTAAPEPPAAEIAQAHEKSIDVYSTADAQAPDRQIVSGVDTSVDTIPVVFLVKGDRVPDAARVEVYLPVRPNGSSGWVSTDDVSISPVPYRIEVGIAEHRIRVFRDEEVIFDEPIGVGRTDRPTPGGIYYLKELLQPPNPNGPYGTYAYGLSGFSNVLQKLQRRIGRDRDPRHQRTRQGGHRRVQRVHPAEQREHRTNGRGDRPAARHAGGDPGVTRRILMVTLAVCLAAGVAACGDDDGEGGPVPPSTADPDSTPTELDGELPPPSALDLEPLYGEALAAAGMQLTDRGGTIDRSGGGYVASPEGTHLALYVEPIDPARTAQEYIDGILDVALVFSDIYDRWPGLESYDVCQEPADPDGTLGPEPLPVTQIELTRAESEAIDWETRHGRGPGARLVGRPAAARPPGEPGAGRRPRLPGHRRGRHDLRQRLAAASDAGSSRPRPRR